MSASARRLANFESIEVGEESARSVRMREGMTAIYGFTDTERFAVVCADNQSPSNPIDKIVRVGTSHFVGVIGQPVAVTLLESLDESLKSGRNLGSIQDFVDEFAERIRDFRETFLADFERERRTREKLPGFEAWDRLIRESPIRLGVLDLRDLSLHELHFGWPLPPGRLRATPWLKSLSAGPIWRFGITAPREASPDTAQLHSAPATLFERLLVEDRAEGVGTLGSLVTYRSGRLAIRSASGEVKEEDLARPAR